VCFGRLAVLSSTEFEKMTPLKRKMAAEMRWNKNEVSRGSSVTQEIR